MRSLILTLAGAGFLCLPSAAEAQSPNGRGNGRAFSPPIEQALSNRGEFAEGRGLSLGQERAAEFSRAGAQAGTGRLGTESVWGRGQGQEMQARFAERGDHARQTWGRERRPGETGIVEDKHSGNESPSRPEIVSHGANRRAATLADRWLSDRLANIDHLRDVALRNGNTQLLEQADQLEAHARQQHLWRAGQIDHPHAAPPADYEIELGLTADASRPASMPLPFSSVQTPAPPAGANGPLRDRPANFDGAEHALQRSAQLPGTRRLPAPQ